MIRRSLLAAVLLSVFVGGQAQTPISSSTAALVQQIQAELSGAFPPEDGQLHAGVPQGEFLHGIVSDSKIYPGTENEFQVYVPAQYDSHKPACLLVKLDGMGPFEGTVLDNLIYQQAIPVMIGVGIVPGTIWKDPAGTPHLRALRFDRSYEFDSVNDHFPDYVLHELLPAVEKLRTSDGRAIHISPSGSDHAVTGGSTGGIGSFTLAWRRPDQFTRVYSVIGTFVSMRGGNDYPALIRKTEPKPIRVFLEDGSADAWNLLFGSWFDANVNMESALSFAGYDVAHAWGTHGHDGRPGQVIFPDVLRWLWRDYPTPIRAGISHNSTLEEITLPNEGWQRVPGPVKSVQSLASNNNGDVLVNNADSTYLYRIVLDLPVRSVPVPRPLVSVAFDSQGVLYGLDSSAKTLVAINRKGAARVVAKHIGGDHLLVTHEGTIFVSEPGAHPDELSRIWRITADGRKQVVDTGLSAFSGIAFSPDGDLFFAAENTTQWIYSYVVNPDGSLRDKQPFYWLHMTDIPNNSGAEDLAVDTHGNLYVATRMGIQVCDQNGRVRAILPLPTPSGPVRSLCFGGPDFDTLYATDGQTVFRRRLKIKGHSQWTAPVAYPSQGAG